MDDEMLDIKLNKIRQPCRKIQAAIFRHGFKMNVELERFDPNGHGLIAESKFNNVLGRYKYIIGLSEFEIREVTDSFRIGDGRIAYKKFCKIICEEGQDHSKDMETVHDLEWTDPMHVNPVADSEKRQLCILLMKISRRSKIPLTPYFQDYELVTGNIGAVTVAHFSRVLHFMKLQLSENDLKLILKRYMKDSYTVNYVAFLTHLDAINEYLKEQGLLGKTNDLIDFPGKLVDLEMPELPYRNPEGINEHGKTFELREKPDDICNTVFRIQRYVYENGIRITEFLETFDLLKSGCITKNQFLRALDNIGISVVSRFKLSQKEIQMLCARYEDHIDQDRIRWRVFTDEIDRVFTEKHLDKQPLLRVESPLQHIETLPKIGQRNWHTLDESIRDLCEEALVRIQNKIIARRIYLHPFFKNFDKFNKGYVSSKQAFQTLLGNSILISEEEFSALERRYCNDLGFNYMRFLEEVDPAEYAIPKLNEPAPLEEVIQPEEAGLVTSNITEQDVINALANAKKQINIRNVKLFDFLADYDRHRENQILETDFRRGLDNVNVKLTVPEVDIICNKFRSHNRGCTVRYRDFCKALDELFIHGPFTDDVLSVPLKQFPCVDCVQCFLNFEERTLASKALQKLARKPDNISNLLSLFKDFDKQNCGTITQNQFLRALTVRDMSNMISSREFEVVCKCFGYERGMQIEFNYRAFLDILTILYETGKIKRNF